MTTAIFSAACTAARLAMADLPVAYAAAVPVEDLALLYDRIVADIRRTLQDPTLPAEPDRVEAVARAICAADGETPDATHYRHNGDFCAPKPDGFKWQQYTSHALAALAAEARAPACNHSLSFGEGTKEDPDRCVHCNGLFLRDAPTPYAYAAPLTDKES